MKNQAQDYIAGDQELLEFYAASPRTLLESPPAHGEWSPELLAALRAYQQRLGTNPSFNGNEAVIITGQQPGIFTGPLYTVYKAITALRLASALQEHHGVPTVPIFWVGSEDHDFEEAQTTYFLTKKHEPLRVSYEPESDIEARPMCRVPVEQQLHTVIDQVAGETPGSEWREPVRAFLHDALDASESLSDWTARILARLFQDTPLIFFTPDLVEARRCAIPIIEKEIAAPLETTRLLNDTGHRLDGLGYPPQVMKGETECSFFLEVEERRRKVIFEGGRFVVPDEDKTFSADELQKLLHESPERFSPNVALRCVVQQNLFPVAAYVAGPGETAYWGQLKPIFERFEKPMPVVWPRASALLTTLKLNKIRRKLGVDLSDLNGHFDGVLEKSLRATSNNDAYKLCQEQRKTIEDSLGKLAADLGSKDPTAAQMAKSLQGEVATKLDRLERSILQADDTKNDATRKQLERLRNALVPNRKPQERVYNVVSFLFEHGWDLVPRLTENLDVESFTMNEMEL